ncbi:unnamed protein product [Urochloa humidicola]
MAAAWRRAWRWWWVSSSTDRGAGAGDSLQLTNYHPYQRSDLVESSNNFGSSYTTGTTLSINTHTTTSSDRVLESARVFHPSVFVPTPAAVVQEKAEEEKLDQARGDKFLEEERAKTREHIRELVRGARGLDRWLSELRVGWVLHPGELDASAGRRFQYWAEGWILAVYVISRSISSFNGWCCPQKEAAAWPPASELVRFIVATLLKMLPFVHTVVTLNTIDNPTTIEHSTVSCYGDSVPPSDKFQALVDVRDALSRVSERFQRWASWLRLSVDLEAVGRIGEISSILFAELGKVDEAIWDTRRYMGNRIMSLMDDDGDSPWRARAQQRSAADIHKVTRSIMSYITAQHWSTTHDLHVTQPKNMSPLADLIMETVHSLQEKIDRKSLSFHDHRLKFLFLINNSYFMWQQLHTNRILDVPITTALALKIDDYIKNYVQVSWTHVLKCLHTNRAPCCFTIYSPLHRFESEFQKAYKAQKLWKVPDPKLRKRLRKAIIEEVIPSITEFLEDNSISNPEVNPEKLEEMLEELFEG